MDESKHQQQFRTDERCTEQDHWTEHRRTASVSNSGVTGRPRRSVPAFGPEMTRGPSYLQNTKDVLDAFGYWPRFHDAPVFDFSYEPDGAGVNEFALHGCEMTAEVDNRGFYKLIKHHLIRFAFREISDPDLERFTSMGNILLGLGFSTAEEYRAAGGCEMRLDAAMGGDLCGSFLAEGGEVQTVIPCEKDGRRTEQVTGGNAG